MKTKQKSMIRGVETIKALNVEVHIDNYKQNKKTTLITDEYCFAHSVFATDKKNRIAWIDKISY